MKDLWIVAKYTAKEMMKRKSFLFSTLLILVLIVIGFNVPNALNALNGKDDTTSETNTILIIDPNNIYENTLDEIMQTSAQDNLEVVQEQVSIETIKEKIEKEEIEAAVLIEEKEEKITAQYITQSLGLNGTVSEELMTLLNESYQNLKMQQAGMTIEQIAEIKSPITVETMELEEGSSGAMLFLAMMLCIVLFYAIYFCAYQVSSSITTEKTSKIMETLVTSTKPSTIVIGKTIGIGLVGLLQVSVIVLTAFLSYQAFMPEGFLEGILDISQITPEFIAVTFIYFILGYTLYAFLYALTGSTISKPEDINSANSPIAILAILGFYLAYFSMMNTAGNIRNFAALFPISSPFSMPFRMIGGNVSLGELALSLGILILTIVIIAKIAIRIYSSAILHYGTKLGLKDIIRMYRDKNN